MAAGSWASTSSLAGSSTPRFGSAPLCGGGRAARSSRGRGGTDVAGRIGALSLERGGGARRRPPGRAAVDAGAVVAAGGEREVKEMRRM